MEKKNPKHFFAHSFYLLPLWAGFPLKKEFKGLKNVFRTLALAGLGEIVFKMCALSPFLQSGRQGAGQLIRSTMLFCFTTHVFSNSPGPCLQLQERLSEGPGKAGQSGSILRGGSKSSWGPPSAIQRASPPT